MSAFYHFPPWRLPPHLQPLRRSYLHDIYVFDMWSFGSPWRLFPRWLKAITLLVGVPAWLGCAALIATGSIFEHQAATLTLFGALAFVAVCQTAFVAQAAWGNDL